jgi:hypothetical protein
MFPTRDSNFPIESLDCEVVGNVPEPFRFSGSKSFSRSSNESSESDPFAPLPFFESIGFDLVCVSDGCFGASKGTSEIDRTGALTGNASTAIGSSPSALSLKDKIDDSLKSSRAISCGGSGSGAGDFGGSGGSGGETVVDDS